MTDDPLDAMKARWSYIQGFLFPWMREDNDPITEALGRLVTTLDVIGLEAFVPEPPRGPGRPPEDRRARVGPAATVASPLIAQCRPSRSVFEPCAASLRSRRLHWSRRSAATIASPSLRLRRCACKVNQPPPRNSPPTTLESGHERIRLRQACA
jgi:hypothetical protein